MPAYLTTRPIDGASAAVCESQGTWERGLFPAEDMLLPRPGQLAEGRLVCLSVAPRVRVRVRVRWFCLFVVDSRHGGSRSVTTCVYN